MDPPHPLRLPPPHTSAPARRRLHRFRVQRGTRDAVLTFGYGVVFRTPKTRQQVAETHNSLMGTHTLDEFGIGRPETQQAALDAGADILWAAGVLRGRLGYGMYVYSFYLWMGLIVG